MPKFGTPLGAPLASPPGGAPGTPPAPAPVGTRGRSLAWHLLIRLLPAVLALAALDTIATYAISRRLGNEVYDRSLIDSARTLARQVRQTADGPRLLNRFGIVHEPSADEVRDDTPAAFSEASGIFDGDPADRVFFRVSARDALLAGRNDLAREPAKPEDADLVPRDRSPGRSSPVDAAAPRVYNTQVDGVEVRAASIQFQLGDTPVDVVVAETLNKRTRVIEEILSVLVGGLTLMVVMLAFVIVTGVRSGLRSISRVSEEIEARGIDDLQPIGTAGVPSEITPLVAQTNSLLARLGQAIAAQRRFIGHAAHQLRTPLTGLKLESELMLSRPLPDDVRQRAERIKSVADRMIRVGEQLLVLARADLTTRPQDSFKTVDLAEVVQEGGAAWVPRARAAQIDIDLDAPSEPVWIAGDPVLLNELLSNLIDNAMRHGSRPGCITLKVCASPPQLIVQDDGPGIGEADIDKVFEPFHRAPDVRASGSGLGLAIVHEIAQAHGGTVKVKSRPAFAGTQFTVNFPAGQGPDTRR